MKTKKYITATLIAMVFTSATVFAQSARRPASQERKEKTTATRTQPREVKKKTAHTTQPARKVQTQQAQRQRNNQATRKVQTQQVQRQRNTQAARKVETQQVQRQRNTQAARKVETQQVQRQRNTQAARKVQTQQVQRQRTANVATSHNPRSTYRKPDSKVYVKHNRNATYHKNKFASERYYGGHHYHYAYPTRKVKIHYHHDTYLHNYHVLYYPSYTNIYWTRNMYRNYRRWYPDYSWNYRYGHRINTISVFDARYNLGEVANVYGRVYATWYNEETNDFLLFFGGDYPYQQFTVVLPARIARKFSWRPERYFLGEHITVTGLITTFDGNPEIVVRDRHQIGVY